MSMPWVDARGLVCAIAFGFCLARGSLADDLVVVGDENGRVYVTFGDGTGTFSPLVEVAKTPGLRCRGATVADFDEDGVADFISGDDQDNLISPYFFKGNADRTFQAPVRLPTSLTAGGYFMDAAAGDFDKDGHADFICGGNNSNVGFYWGNGNGTFVQELKTMGTYGRGMDTGDFNGDGSLDFVRGQWSEGYIRLYLGNGARGFTEAPALVGDAGGDPYGVAAGDFDCDGDLDVLANEGGSGDYTHFRGQGDGTFLAGVARPEIDTNNYSSADALDFDRDGALDVVVTTYTSLFNYLGRGKGDGTFQGLVQLPGRPSTASLGIGCAHAPPDLNVQLDPPNPVVGINAPLAMTVLGSDVNDAHTFAWTFGDGSTGTGRNVLPTYTTEGVYSIS